MSWLQAMLAGAVSILTFHQGMLALLHLGRMTTARPWPLHATWPLGWPLLLTQSLFGALLALPLWALIRNRANAGHWLRAMILGALLGAAFELLALAPLRGHVFAAGLDAQVWVRTILLYGSWGLGVAAWMQGLRRH